MIRKIYNYMYKEPPIPAIFVDGTIYVLLAVVLFLQNMMASDEAGKFISLEILWWLKLLIGSLGAALLAIKLYRSTAYARHTEAVDEAKTLETKDVKKEVKIVTTETVVEKPKE